MIFGIDVSAGHTSAPAATSEPSSSRRDASMAHFRKPPVRYRSATSIFAVLVALVGVVAQAREPAQWQWDDWAAVAVTILVGGLFGYFGWLGSLRQADLTRALANVTLREKAGAIGTDSLRILSNALDLSLHVGRDALSAMPLFAVAEGNERDSFAHEVLRGYSSLLLNCFPKSTAMPLGSIRRLHEDGKR